MVIRSNHNPPSPTPMELVSGHMDMPTAEYTASTPAQSQTQGTGSLRHRSTTHTRPRPASSIHPSSPGPPPPPLTRPSASDASAYAHPHPHPPNYAYGQAHQQEQIPRSRFDRRGGIAADGRRPFELGAAGMGGLWTPQPPSRRGVVGGGERDDARLWSSPMGTRGPRSLDLGPGSASNAEMGVEVDVDDRPGLFARRQQRHQAKVMMMANRGPRDNMPYEEAAVQLTACVRETRDALKVAHRQFGGEVQAVRAYADHALIARLWEARVKGGGGNNADERKKKKQQHNHVRRPSITWAEGLKGGLDDMGGGSVWSNMPPHPEAAARSIVARFDGLFELLGRTALAAAKAARTDGLAQPFSPRAGEEHDRRNVAVELGSLVPVLRRYVDAAMLSPAKVPGCIRELDVLLISLLGAGNATHHGNADESRFPTPPVKQQGRVFEMTGLGEDRFDIDVEWENIQSNASSSAEGVGESPGVMTW